MKFSRYLACSALFLAACGSHHTAPYQSYLAGRKLAVPAKNEIHHCYAYGCQKISKVSLTDEEWRQVTKIFKPKAKTPEKERQQIKKAIGLLERIIGPKDGTQDDIAGTFRETGPYQLDCVDESTNTTIYLALLESEGLLHFHQVNGPTMRFPVINAGRWPHQTAVITDTTTKTPYAVDSWFHDNGGDAEIIDLKTWKEGWKPESVRDFL
jgi:hypothetical protein